MIIKNVKKYFFTYVVPTFYGGGSGGGQNTTVQQRNIPKELAPYYEVLLNSMMKQGFTSSNEPKSTPAKLTTYEPKYEAPVHYAKGGEVKRYAAGGTSVADTLSSLGSKSGVLNPTGIRPYEFYGQNTDPTSPDYNTVDYASYVAQPTALQEQSYKAAGSMALPQQNIAASNLAAAAGQGALNTAGTGLDYGTRGYDAGLNAATLGNAGADTAAQNANILGNSALNYGGLGAMMGAAGAASGNVYENKATNAGTVQSYMNPYLDASLKPQLALMDQENAIANQKANSQAAQQGAYGGSRQTVANNLNDQSNKLAQANLIGQGYKSAYDTAQSNILQGSQLGLQGYNAGIQGAQTGLSGVNAATGAGQYGLSGVGAGIEGQKTAMQGAQTGLSGVGAAQAGYGLAGQQGQNLSNIGNTQLAQQQSIAGMQNTYGAQKQSLDQQAINNAIGIKDYQQKYPWEILGGISNALNGVQTGSMTGFTPAPSFLSQAGGLGATALGVAGASGAFKKKGGVIKEPKAKSGGIGDLAVYNAMKGGK